MFSISGPAARGAGGARGRSGISGGAAGAHRASRPATQRHTCHADTPRGHATPHGTRRSTAHSPVTALSISPAHGTILAATAASLHQQKACTVAREHNHLPAHPTTRRGSRAVVYEKAVTTREGRSPPYRRVTRASASSKTRDPRLPITGHKSIASGTQALGAEGYRGRRGRTTTTHASSSDAMARVTLERRLHAARSFESASSGAGLPSVSAACSVAI